MRNSKVIYLSRGATEGLRVIANRALSGKTILVDGYAEIMEERRLVAGMPPGTSADEVARWFHDHPSAELLL